MTVENEAPEAGEVDVDQLLADVEAGKEVGQAPAAAEAPAEAPPEAPTWNGQEWEFAAGGKKVIPTSRDELKLWAGQGYHFSQRMAELKKSQEQWEAERQAKLKEIEAERQRFAPYADVDKYAQENKEWWEHVQEAYKARQTHGVDPTVAKVLSPIQEKLSTLEQIIEEQRQAQQRAVEEVQHKQEDEALEAEIESIRKSHPNIDLSARDESGETLEWRVMKHAREIGTHSFRAAFRDYLHDQLVVQQQAQAKLQAVKGAQAQAKAGILGKTPAPTKGLKPVDPKRPWSDPQFDVQTILEELAQQGG